jgi:hypothetical protein
MKAKSLLVILTFIVILFLLLASAYLVIQFYTVQKPNDTNNQSAFQQHLPEGRVIPAVPSIRINEYLDGVINPNLGNCKVEYIADEELVPGEYTSENLDILRDYSGVLTPTGALRPDRAYEARTVRVEGGLCAFALVEQPGNVRHIIYQKIDGSFEEIRVN